MRRYFIREANLRDTDVYGVAFDFRDIAEFFNYALAQGDYLFVPRAAPVTEKELRNHWMPNARKGKTWTFVAEDISLKKIVASSTLFVNAGKERATLSLVKDPRYHVRGVATRLARTAIHNAVEDDLTVYVHALASNAPVERIMGCFGLVPGVIHGHPVFRHFDENGVGVNEWRFDRSNWYLFK